MRRFRLWALAALMASLLVTEPGVAEAEHVPLKGLVVTDIQRGTLAEGVKSHVGGIKVHTKGPVDVVTVEGTFPMGGGSAGWHTHPGPVFVVMRSGTLTVFDEHCNRQTYSAGAAFFEEGPKHSMLVRNESSTVDATFYATFIVPVGAAPLSVPRPHLCGQPQ